MPECRRSRTVSTHTALARRRHNEDSRRNHCVLITIKNSLQTAQRRILKVLDFGLASQKTSLQMISRAMAPMTIFLVILATSLAQQERNMGVLPSRYSFYQDRGYGYAPQLTLFKTLARPVAKRNNAEVVNHILKNFGTLDRLGDVGR
ncbi:unnamed protein product [Cylicocyclus nassatus]|uniref:Uncharacterized protein n=1 Tax=Cylicocyclus nassatus TaxID=53992 RepID=A0AA36MIC0_CYLNA|nr:unnamed protein product [Cylicocyclus nassatus]